MQLIKNIIHGLKESLVEILLIQDLYVCKISFTICPWILLLNRRSNFPKIIEFSRFKLKCILKRLISNFQIY